MINEKTTNKLVLIEARFRINETSSPQQTSTELAHRFQPSPSSTTSVSLLPELLVSRVVSCLSSGSPVNQARALILQRLIKGTSK